MNAFQQFLRYRRRLVLAIVIGIAAAILLPGHLSVLSRVLLGWNVMVWLYLGLIWLLMARAHHNRVKELAMREDESAPVVLIVVCIAAVASIVAIVFELGTAKQAGLGSSFGHYAFTGATVLGAWFLIPTLFTLHYARLYFGSDKKQPALLFPDHDLQPDYWDFLYFSFTIAVASQTSDVELASREMRRAGLAQSVLAFYFNASILALVINIAAGLLST